MQHTETATFVIFNWQTEKVQDSRSLSSRRSVESEFETVDLWVIKIFKKPMILCARSTSRSSEQCKKRRSRSENKRKVCLFYNQNNKIVWLSNSRHMFLKNSPGAQRFVGFPFLIVLFRRWLAGRAILSSVLLGRNFCDFARSANQDPFIFSSVLLGRRFPSCWQSRCIV